jgi:hypothetical protein
MDDPVTGTRSEVQTIWTRALLGIQPGWGRDFDDLSIEWRRLFGDLGDIPTGARSSGGPGGVGL